MAIKIIKLFLRLSISAGFFSAVADRFGLWQQGAAWGDWSSFVAYTGLLLPWFSPFWVNAFAVVATVVEMVCAFAILIGWKTRFFALISGFLLLSFGIFMSISLGIKKPLDYSVFSAAGAAFALSFIKVKFFELDSISDK